MVSVVVILLSLVFCLYILLPVKAQVLTSPTVLTCGINLELTCSLSETFDSGRSRYWVGPSGNTLVNDGISSDVSKYEEDISNAATTNSFILRIKNVAVADAGAYTCTYKVTTSPSKTVPFECANGEPLVSRKDDGRREITIDQVYPSTSTITVSANNAQISGTTSNIASTTDTSLYKFTWVSTESLSEDTFDVVINTGTVQTHKTGTFRNGTTTTTATTTTPTTRTTATKTATKSTSTPSTTTTTSSTTITAVPPLSTTTSEAGDNSSTTLIIVLSVVGGVFILGILGTLLVLYLRKHSTKAPVNGSSAGIKKHERSSKQLHRKPMDRDYDMLGDNKTHDQHRAYDQYQMSPHYWVPDQNRVHGRQPETHYRMYGKQPVNQYPMYGRQPGIQYQMYGRQPRTHEYRSRQQAVSHVKINPMFEKTNYDNYGYVPNVRNERGAHGAEDNRNYRNINYSNNWG